MKLLIITAAAFVMFLCSPAYAHDTLHGLLNNHHDIFIIGSISEVTDDAMYVDITRQIISPANCSRGCGFASRHHAFPDGNIRINFSEFSTAEERGSYHAGDCVAAAADVSGDGFIEKHIFKTDSDDYRSLRITAPPMNRDIAALNCFINSDGLYHEYSFANSEVTRSIDGTVIYSASEPDKYEFFESDIESDKTQMTPLQLRFDDFVSRYNISGIVKASAVILLAAALTALWIIRLKKRAKWKHYIENQNK